MAIPSLSDLNFYVGNLLNNNDWDKNWSKLISYLTDGTGEFTYKSFTVNTASSMGGAKITNLGTPTIATDAATKSYVDTVSLPKNYIAGYILSNNASVPTTDIDIAAGICQNSTNVQGIVLSTAFTKRASAAWVAGTGAGMLDTGAIANSTWYYIFAISKADGTSDILSSTSATTPTLPTGYTIFRRIGAIKTDSSGNILGFIQSKDLFMLKTHILDVSSATTTTANRTLYTLTIPPISNIIPIFNAVFNTSGTANYILITSPLQTDSAASASLFDGLSASSNSNPSITKQIVTNSGQIGARTSATNTILGLTTSGWIDNRGAQ